MILLTALLITVSNGLEPESQFDVIDGASGNIRVVVSSMILTDDSLLKEGYRLITWSVLPSPEQVDQLGGKLAVAEVQANIECSLTPGGTLEGCSPLTVQPDSGSSKTAIWNVLQILRADKDFAQRYHGSNSGVSIQVKIANARGVHAKVKPCVSPFCVVHYGYPPSAK